VLVSYLSFGSGISTINFVIICLHPVLRQELVCHISSFRLQLC
jgi:hypothetical protein